MTDNTTSPVFEYKPRLTLPSTIPDRNIEVVADEWFPEFPQSMSNPELLHTPAKRGLGCQEINATTYTTDGGTFNILCDTTYSWTKCPKNVWVYITWANGQYGPEGYAGGSECYFFWDLSGSASDTGHDSGQLEISGPQPTSQVIVPNLTDPECVPLNQTNYETTTGEQFFIFCDGVFQSSSDLYFTIVSDFLSCIEGCASWNKNSSVPCVGVSYGLGVYGPDGEGNGSWCLYRWTVSENSFGYVKGWNSAQLIGNPNSSVTTTKIVSTPTVTILPSGGTTTSTQSTSQSGLSKGEIGGLIGGIIGLIAFLAIILLIFCLLKIRRNPRGGNDTEQEKSSTGSPRAWESINVEETVAAAPMTEEGMVVNNTNDLIERVGGGLRYPEEGARLQGDIPIRASGRLGLADDGDKGGALNE